MGDAVAPLSEDAITRLGADAYLLDGSRAHAERLLRAAVLDVAAKRADAAHTEARVRAALADRYLHHRRLHRALHHHHARHPASVGVGVGVVARLAALTPRERAVMVLRHVDGLSVAEIADALGLPDRTVGAALRSGVATLGSARDAPAGADVTEDTLVTPRRSRGRRAGAA